MIDDETGPVGLGPSEDGQDPAGFEGGGQRRRRDEASRDASSGWAAIARPAMIGGAIGAVSGLVLPGSIDLGRGLLYGALAGAAFGWWKARAR